MVVAQYTGVGPYQEQREDAEYDNGSDIAEDEDARSATFQLHLHEDSTDFEVRA